MNNREAIIHEHILGILDQLLAIYGECEGLIAENEALQAKLDDSSKAIEPDERLDHIVLWRGREKVYEESIVSWNCYTKEGMPYTEWLKAKIMCVPDYMSRNEFEIYFHNFLHADFTREKVEFEEGKC